MKGDLNASDLFRTLTIHRPASGPALADLTNLSGETDEVVAFITREGAFFAVNRLHVGRNTWTGNTSVSWPLNRVTKIRCYKIQINDNVYSKWCIFRGWCSYSSLGTGCCREQTSG